MKSLQERFEEKFITEPNSGCWLWAASVNEGGYGQIRDGVRMRKAHIVSYEFSNGSVPVGLELDHKCRVTSCVNPAHLEAVTHKENMRRGINALPSINARKTHCKRGHLFDIGNTIVRGGQRRCRICDCAWFRERSRTLKRLRTA